MRAILSDSTVSPRTTYIRLCIDIRILIGRHMRLRKQIILRVRIESFGISYCIGKNSHGQRLSSPVRQSARITHQYSNDPGSKANK